MKAKIAKGTKFRLTTRDGVCAPRWVVWDGNNYFVDTHPSEVEYVKFYGDHRDVVRYSVIDGYPYSINELMSDLERSVNGEVGYELEDNTVCMLEQLVCEGMVIP